MSAALVPDEAVSTNLLCKQSLWWPLHVSILYFFTINKINKRPSQLVWLEWQYSYVIYGPSILYESGS